MNFDDRSGTIFVGNCVHVGGGRDEPLGPFQSLINHRLELRQNERLEQVVERLARFRGLSTAAFAAVVDALER